MNLEISNNQKKHKTRKIKKIIRDAVALTLDNTKTGQLIKSMGVIPVFSILITDNRYIRKLNFEYRNVDNPTDVLSFPSIEFNGKIIEKIDINDLYYENGKMKINFGDMAISLQKAMEQSIALNNSFEREVFFLTVHSVLHLFGYDHMNERDEKAMIKKQKEIMNIALNSIFYEKKENS